MKVIEHRIVQSINLTPGVEATKRSELEKRLLALKTAINTELASRGVAIGGLAYSQEKDIYHYDVPASYCEEDYPVIKAMVERYCGYYDPSELFIALNPALVIVASGVSKEEAKLKARAFGCSTPVIARVRK